MVEQAAGSVQREHRSLTSLIGVDEEEELGASAATERDAALLLGVFVTEVLETDPAPLELDLFLVLLAFVA